MTDDVAAAGDWLARPVDAASLAVVRILFGAILFAGLVRFMAEGWIEVLYVEPKIFLKYWGFAWVGVWSRAGMYAHYALLAGLALALAAGYRTRLAAALFFIGFTYVELVDVTNYLNHYYLVSIVALLMIFLPVGQVWSWDACRTPSPSTTVPAWVLYLLRFQVAVVYLNAGLAKLGSDWLLHAQPLGIWLAARDETPLIGSWLASGWVAYAMSWGGFLFDTTIVLWLSLRRTRPFAYALVVVFHLLTHVFFDIGLFPFLMTALATIFFAPDWPRRFPGNVSPSFSRKGQGGGSYLPSRAAAVAIAVFCIVQVALPLRHLAYPGDVLWNEQGMRWAWKVMVREKNGSITYHVRDRDSGRSWQLSPTRYLTWRQANEMAGQPDLVLQLAHHIAADLRARGVRDPEVRAEAWVSLNGRRAALMIDPSVDLTRIDDGVTSASWILPAPQDPPLPVPAQLAALAGE
ncbi:MAG TPA: HTTM domain-containing protein [Terriglobales bacterium]|nr:HTTM domain-containing protein [Terriglobales bacterium]